MAKKKTQEKFVKEVFDLVGDEYVVLGVYKNNKTKIEIKHVDCGHEWKVIPNGFLNRTRCHLCFGKFKKTTKTFKKEIFDLVGKKYEILGEYLNTETKIKIKHVECGHEYEATPHNFLRGRRCPKCSNRKTHEEFEKEVFDKFKGEYEVIGTYVKGNVTVRMLHTTCGLEWDIRPGNLLSGNRCPACSRGRSTEEFKKIIFDLVGKEYEVLGEYKRADKKIEMKHIKCGYEWEVRPSDFMGLKDKDGTRCPKCCNSKAFSKGEKELVDFIKENYDGEIIENDRTIIPSMTTDRMYELDIYIPRLKLAIEYNGSYWHEKRELEVPGYHTHKQRICDEEGIELINVDDDDWKNEEKREIMKMKIKEKIK